MIGDFACNAGALCLAGGGAKPPHRGGACGREGPWGGGLVGGVGGALIVLFQFPCDAGAMRQQDEINMIRIPFVCRLTWRQTHVGVSEFSSFKSHYNFRLNQCSPIGAREVSYPSISCGDSVRHNIMSIYALKTRLSCRLPPRIFSIVVLLLLPVDAIYLCCTLCALGQLNRPILETNSRSERHYERN